LIHIFEGKYALLNLLTSKNLGLATEEPVVYNVNKTIGFVAIGSFLSKKRWLLGHGR
jgi:hypothetical protein